jgi:vacuolar protein sorting-associated protein 1
MISSYIKDPRTIILTVVPATVDISTTEAIKIAHEYDKNAVRTVGVLTKVDLMDRGTDASQVLKNKSQVKLDLGIIAVKNRSKEDIDNKISLNDARDAEKRFFENHQIYKNLKSLCGTDQLAELLSKLFKSRINDEIPLIKKEIEERLSKIKVKLSELGEEIPKSEIEQQKLVFRLIEQFCTQLRLFIDGEEKNLDEKFEGNPSNELHKLLFEYGQTVIKSSPDYQSDDYRKEIRSELDQSRGRELSGFLPFRVFTRIIHKQLQELEEPSIDLLDDVSIFIENLMNKIAELLVKKFPLILLEMKTIFNSLIEEKKKMATQMVKDEIIKEKFIFTNNQYTILIP